MVSQMAFKQVFGNTPVAKILDHLLEHHQRDFSLTELSRECGVAYRTLQRVFPPLVKQGLVLSTRRIGRAQMYRLNTTDTRLLPLFQSMSSGPCERMDESHCKAYQ